MDCLPHDDPELLDRLFGDEVRRGDFQSPVSVEDVWKNAYSENTNRKVWAAKFAARHPNLVALELSSFKCGHGNKRNTSEHRDKARAVAAYLETIDGAGTAEVNAPLTDKQKQAYVGRYEAGAFDSLRFEVAVVRRGQLTIKQMPDGVARNLNSRGNHAFNPSGVDEVRIEFEMNAEQATRLTIHDPDVTIVARRI